MWSRLIVPLNKSFVHKSLVCLPNRNFATNILVLSKYKQTTDQDFIDRPNKSQQKQFSEKKKMENDNKPDDVLFKKNDSKVFGTLNRQVAKTESNERDEIEYPLRRNQLPQYMYENMVKKNIRDKRLKEAIDVVEVRMKADRVQPEYYIYDLLIMECGRMGYTKEAFKLYNRMKKRGLKVTGPTYTALFNAVAKTIHPNDGLKLAENLRQILIKNGFPMNEKIYNTMIKAFGRCGDIHTAFQLVDEMKEKKLQLNIDTMNHLLQVCCSDKEYGFRHALFVWHKIYQRGMTPDAYSFNLMLRCVRDCGIGDLEEMQRVIGTILKSSKAAVKIKSNKDEKLLIEAKPLISINENDNKTGDSAGDLESKQTTNEVTSKDVCDQMPNLLSELPHLGSIVQLSMVKSAEDRLILLGGFSGFIDEMEKTNAKATVKTFTQIMDSIPSTREAEHQLIERTRKMNVWCDTDFFNLLMKRRILRKDYDGAKEVLKMLELTNLEPDIVTYGVMAMGCINRQQAKEFFDKLAEKGVRLNNEILGALMKNAAYIKDFDYAIDILKYAMTEDIKPSFKFTEIVSKFSASQYRTVQENNNAQDLERFRRFYKIYKEWKTQMELNGLTTEEISKRLNVHPWKQLKEGEQLGIEMVKNQKTRRYWKKQHLLKKLKPSRLERLS